MTSEINYYDSNFTYISPIRHFKANDPYYFEVDNIPIKQLEESKSFLKDQIDGILRDRANFTLSVGRDQINELQPFVNGSDRKVRVRPGRYTARVNDAYNITPIQFIKQTIGFNSVFEGNAVSPMPKFEAGNVLDSTVSAALDIFQAGLAGTALNMNGLAERTFVYPVADPKRAQTEGSVQYLNATSIADYLDLRLNNGDGISNPPNNERSAELPNIIGQLYRETRRGVPLETHQFQLIRNVQNAALANNGNAQTLAETDFIKRFRGAIRTSIVDVSGELSVTVPDFDESDFFFIDSNGDTQQLTASQRIDLIFIYSKAIDQETTTLNSRDPGSTINKIISKPSLGILKGAGVGMSRRLRTGLEGAGGVSLESLDGTPIMFAHPGDETGLNTGFETSAAGVIRGSFPSPDDLLNLAPVLSDQLESDSIALIGQSILPVAYVRVTNSGGTADILSDADLIDIRPFFRTTELAYNERAGIAAATPQISMANPVASETYVEKTRVDVVNVLNSKIDAIEIPPEPPSRIVGMGNICGGMRYGPEGALFRQLNAQGFRDTSWNELADLVETHFNYPPGSITFETGWDPAPWALTKAPNPGTRGADAIHVCWPMIAESTYPEQYHTPPFNKSIGMGTFNTINLVKANQGSNTSKPGLNTFGINKFKADEIVPDLGLPNGSKTQHQNVVIHFCRKIIRINRDDVSWMSDYSVNVQLLNCIPLSAAANGGSKRQGNAAGSSNVWVNKFRDYFVINVAWCGADFNDLSDPNTFSMDNAYGIPWAKRNTLDELAGFATPELPVLEEGNFKTYTATFRNMPEGPAGQGSDILSTLNSERGGGESGLQNRTTEIQYFTNVTPVLYPSVTYEIIGHRQQMVNNSPKGHALAVGRTPTINLI